MEKVAGFSGLCHKDGHEMSGLCFDCS